MWITPHEGSNPSLCAKKKTLLVSVFFLALGVDLSPATSVAGFDYRRRRYPAFSWVYALISSWAVRLPLRYRTIAVSRPFFTPCECLFLALGVDLSPATSVAGFDYRQRRYPAFSWVFTSISHFAERITHSSRTLAVSRPFFHSSWVSFVF